MRFIAGLQQDQRGQVDTNTWRMHVRFESALQYPERTFHSRLDNF